MTFALLADKAASGDRAALERLWNNLAPHAWKQLYARHGAEMADELINEVFLKVFKKGVPNPERFREFEYAKSYTFCACESVFISRARKFCNAKEAPSSTESAFESVSAQVDEDRVLSEIALNHFRMRLNGPLLETFDAWRSALKETSNLSDSYLEVAGTLGLPVTTIKKRCLNLRGRLASLYSP
jgi:DNA-directed RNA polymerase specialized sigma24 family protein